MVHPLLGQVGIIGMDPALPSKAICFVCNKAVPEGETRIKYKTRQGSSMRLEHILHIACSRGVPKEHTAVNQVAISKLLQGLPAMGDEAAALMLAQSMLPA